jgi:hypothetical protein
MNERKRERELKEQERSQSKWSIIY